MGFLNSIALRNRPRKGARFVHHMHGSFWDFSSGIWIGAHKHLYNGREKERKPGRGPFHATLGIMSFIE